MTRSIRARVLLAASLALAGFLGLTGFALDRAFRSSAESTQRDYLQTQIYGLLTAAEVASDNRLTLPRSLPEPRLSRTGSGLYAWVTDGSGATIWKSPSALGTGIPDGQKPAAGEFTFRKDRTPGGKWVFVFNYSVIWETGDGGELPFVLSVAEDLSLFHSRVNAFRRTLWLWLSGSAVVLVILQLIVLMWILKPLRKIAAEISEVESGARERLSTDYPEELQSLALNLNALLVNERKQRQRYRDKLDDLAHSLKTPLAVLRNLVDRQEECDLNNLSEVTSQVDRMQDIVSYQLQSASIGRSKFSLAHPVKPEIEKVARSLTKAYYERSVDVDVDVPAMCRFRGEVGDLVEIVGNIMDNAYKHCRSKVALRVEQNGGGDELIIMVDDDGPGIPEARRTEIAERRVCGDSRTEGQGIGLAIVRDIATDYGGSLEIRAAALGGARVVVRFPGMMRR
ncbi:MAG: Virulence sensor histidine kinase PhoQ [Gammaproteobacteria bacterium]|nr:Virulence sensor histidine kinase PhoQ [Gammaproteobacteria bacterium]